MTLASFQSNLQDALIARAEWELHRREIAPYTDKMYWSGKRGTITVPEIDEFTGLRLDYFEEGGREELGWQMEEHYLKGA